MLSLLAAAAGDLPLINPVGIVAAGAAGVGVLAAAASEVRAGVERRSHLDRLGDDMQVRERLRLQAENAHAAVSMRVKSELVLEKGLMALLSERDSIEDAIQTAAQRGKDPDDDLLLRRSRMTQEHDQIVEEIDRRLTQRDVHSSLKRAHNDSLMATTSAVTSYVIIISAVVLLLTGTVGLAVGLGAVGVLMKLQSLLFDARLRHSTIEADRKVARLQAMGDQSKRVRHARDIVSEIDTPQVRDAALANLASIVASGPSALSFTPPRGSDDQPAVES